MPLYGGDALYFEAWAKGLLHGNWPWHNASLGMPFGADWRDFPVNLTIEAVCIRLLAIFTSSPGLVLNLLWMLGTATSAGFAAYGLQRLGVERWVAGSLGIIYALQPFTFYRGVSHFNLMFYLVPLLAMGAIEIAAGRVPAHRSLGLDAARGSRRPQLIPILRTIPTYLCLACLAQGFTYIYYAFFSAVLFGVAALLALTVHRRRGALVASFVAIAIMCGAALVNLVPSLVYWSEHGTNPAMAYKSPVEAEIYGLKLRHLLTPIPENPFPPLKYIQKKLDNAGFDDQYENATSRLGTIGSVGFLFLLASALASCLRKPFGDDRSSGILGACSALTLTCVLLAAVGGFGSLFNVFVAPDIRSYNRIVVFIDFFAIAAIGLLLTRASAWCLRRHWPKPILRGALGVLVVFGVADQAVVAIYWGRAARQSQFQSEGKFVRSVEAALPRNASVFELPFTTFPAETPPFKMSIYDQGMPYLHSDSLRWSWGAMSGREGAEWIQQTSTLPVKNMLARLSDAGFSGIWIDRFGYAPGTSPEREIGAALGEQPLQRSDGRIAVYDLSAYTKQLRNSKIPRPVELTFPVGFYDQEHDGTQTWRWCSQHGVIQLRNPLSQTRSIKLDMLLETRSTQKQTIWISAGGQSEAVFATIQGAPFIRNIQVPPRQTVSVSFDCRCTPVNAPGDPRNLFFEIVNAKFVQ
ncbi:MAG: hypothetical protein M3Y72_11900 [Acidobacteriota bacterium]|nr:hypothetical protein [Acidobacteriota bacterium]